MPEVPEFVDERAHVYPLIPCAFSSSTFRSLTTFAHAVATRISPLTSDWTR